MDHRAFLAGLDAATKAELSLRSTLRGLTHLAGHLGAIAVCGALIAWGVPGWPLLLPVQGILIVFLFTLEHECTHRTPFASDGLSDWVGRFCGLVLVLPFTWFRYFHLAHHRFTNDPERDPELAGGGLPTTLGGYLWHVSGLPYWGSMIAQFGALLLGRGLSQYVPPSAQARVVAEARWMALAYLLLGASLAMSPLLIWVWIVPVLLGQPVLRLYLMAEHGRCPNVADMFDNTRTTFTNRLVRWLAWNMPYHAEHHSMPSVPFHKLPKLHSLARGHLKQTESGYSRFQARHVRDLI